MPNVNDEPFSPNPRGDKQSRINTSEGRRREMINLSEGEMQRTINEAEGKASEILAMAEATAGSIEKIGAAVIEDGGAQAIRLDMAGKYIANLGYLASPGTDVMLPADLTQFEKLLAGLELSVKTEAKA